MSNEAPTSATVVESLIERCFGAELCLSFADDAVVAAATLVAVEAGRRKTARRGSSEERAIIEAIIWCLLDTGEYGSCLCSIWAVAVDFFVFCESESEQSAKCQDLHRGGNYISLFWS